MNNAGLSYPEAKKIYKNGRINQRTARVSQLSNELNPSDSLKHLLHHSAGGGPESSHANNEQVNDHLQHSSSPVVNLP